MGLIVCNTPVEVAVEGMTGNVEVFSDASNRGFRIFWVPFLSFLYSAIACCSLASVSARPGSLARGVVEDDFNLVSHK